MSSARRVIGSFAGGTARSVRIAIRRRTGTAATASVACAATLVWVLPGAGNEARAVLSIFLAAIVCWTSTELDDTLVAIVAAVGAVLVGGLGEATLFASLGAETVWLLIGGFMMSTAAAACGLTTRLAAAALRSARSLRGLVLRIVSALMIASFMIPSTSARAAMALPVYVAVVRAVDRPSVTRALGVLFRA